jgi:hypothetical protein
MGVILKASLSYASGVRRRRRLQMVPDLFIDSNLIHHHIAPPFFDRVASPGRDTETRGQEAETGPGACSKNTQDCDDCNCHWLTFQFHRPCLDEKQNQE